MALKSPLVKSLHEANYSIPFTSLTSVQVEISSACNLRCPQCFNRIPEHVTALMKPELWEEKIRPHLGQFTDVHLVGIGEPLLHSKFFDWVQEAKAAGAKVHTTSNMQLMTSDRAERLVRSGLDVLSFSCDGASKETYESIRIRGTLERLKRGVDAVLEAKARNNLTSPSLTLNFGATRRNIHELEHVVEFAINHGVGCIIAYHNVAYLEENSEDSLFHDQALSDACFVKAQKLSADNGIVFLSPGTFANPIRYGERDIYCNYPFGNIYIYSDGRVGPCCMDFPDRIILGDLRESSLPEIWNGAQLRTLRSEMCGSPTDTCKFCVSHLKLDVTDPRYLFRFPGAEAYLEKLERSKDRKTGQYYGNSRPEILALVSENAREILDVGCAAGFLGQAIKFRQPCRVTGIEYIEEIAAEAAKRLDVVLSGDAIVRLSELPDQHFDAIIMADVLEHLADSEAVLTLVKRKLKHDGQLILSVPNVRHWSVVLGLLQGEWNYVDAGILDRTHLRFFTRRSLVKLLTDMGFAITNMQATLLGEAPQGFSHSLRSLGIDVGDFEDEARHYQYLVVVQLQNNSPGA